MWLQFLSLHFPFISFQSDHSTALSAGDCQQEETTQLPEDPAPGSRQQIGDAGVSSRFFFPILKPPFFP